jgi:hypothetical protein
MEVEGVWFLERCEEGEKTESRENGCWLVNKQGRGQSAVATVELSLLGWLHQLACHHASY